LKHFHDEYAGLNREHQEMEMERRDYQDYFDTLRNLYTSLKPQPEPAFDALQQRFQATMKEDSDMISEFVKEIDELQNVINRYEKGEITYEKAEQDRRVLDSKHQKVQSTHEKISKDLDKEITELKELITKAGGKDKIPAMYTKNRDALKTGNTATATTTDTTKK
jgi:chromosome segregation ATPase